MQKAFFAAIALEIFILACGPVAAQKPLALKAAIPNLSQIYSGKFTHPTEIRLNPANSLTGSEYIDSKKLAERHLKIGSITFSINRKYLETKIVLFITDPRRIVTYHLKDKDGKCWKSTDINKIAQGQKKIAKFPKRVRRASFTIQLFTDIGCKEQYGHYLFVLIIEDLMNNLIKEFASHFTPKNLNISKAFNTINKLDNMAIEMFHSSKNYNPSKIDLVKIRKLYSDKYKLLGRINKLLVNIKKQSPQQYIKSVIPSKNYQIKNFESALSLLSMNIGSSKNMTKLHKLVFAGANNCTKFPLIRQILSSGMWKNPGNRVFQFEMNADGSASEEPPLPHDSDVSYGKVLDAVSSSLQKAIKNSTKIKKATLTNECALNSSNSIYSQQFWLSIYWLFHQYKTAKIYERGVDEAFKISNIIAAASGAKKVSPAGLNTDWKKCRHSRRQIKRYPNMFNLYKKVTRFLYVYMQIVEMRKSPDSYQKFVAAFGSLCGFVAMDQTQISIQLYKRASKWANISPSTVRLNNNLLQ